MEAFFHLRPNCLNFELTSPQMKQEFLITSSLFCFSERRSAKVSMMTPKIRFRTIMMTMKKKTMSKMTLAGKSDSCKGAQWNYRVDTISWPI